MPVYEFYCADCHMIFNFFSRRVNTDKRPDCPRCGRPQLERQVSLFAISKGRKEEDEGDLPDFDESRMERAMMELAAEAENMNEDDPRQAARMMRRLYETMGLQPGAGMQEAIRRMEAGEDPDQIEAELGDLLEEEDPFSGALLKKGVKGVAKAYTRPRVDERLYEL
ncbi:MAG: cytochrome c [Candidatus Tectimicrobiota bacterium]|nr:MAG: cytochrome c [Candidatus Tectomicrobia bacterium]